MGAPSCGLGFCGAVDRQLRSARVLASMQRGLLDAPRGLGARCFRRRRLSAFRSAGARAAGWGDRLLARRLGGGESGAGRARPSSERARFRRGGGPLPWLRPARPAWALLETDTLILIGDADDRTPMARCGRWRDAVKTNGHVVQMKVYHGARHGFDAPHTRIFCRPLRRRAGPGGDGRRASRDPQVL